MEHTLLHTLGVLVPLKLLVAGREIRERGGERGRCLQGLGSLKQEKLMVEQIAEQN